MLNEAIVLIMTISVKICMDAMMFMIIHTIITDMPTVPYGFEDTNGHDGN